MKKLLAALFLLSLCMPSFAGRMPDNVESVEAIGKGYVKLNIAKNSPDAEYDYQVVSATDIKRLVGGSNKKNCFIFYFTGIETLKIQVSNQACSAIVKELIVAQS
ncbi:hypothetical protein [Cellvibrio mixtus]|uniref:hypothetical protein n=1 Tax=Cellvibrio mixtus TaxID=39650 RepID=UPI000AEE37BD|nr:hypothetical protein [Cellvibrio mixtus]